MRRFGYAVVLLVMPNVAHAQAVGCIKHAEQGQVLRDRGQLVEAKASFVACAAATCPQVVREDCTTFLRDLDARIPSVVLAAADADGRDLVDVRVTMDGAPLADKLTGAAVEVNTGPHVFRFEHPGRTPVQTTVLVREWEKGRRVNVVMVDAPVAAPAVEPAEAADRSPPVLTWVLGGVALVGVGAFAGFWLSGQSDQEHLERSCAPFCRAEQVEPIERKYVIADVALGVGGVAAIGAALAYILRPSPKRVAPRDRLASH